MIHFAGALSCANEFMSPSPFQLQGQGLSNCQHQPAGGIDLEAGKLQEILLTSASHRQVHRHLPPVGVVYITNIDQF